MSCIKSHTVSVYPSAIYLVVIVRVNYLIAFVAGITYSDDKLLQTRVNAYADTQRYRLGVKCELAAVRLALHYTSTFPIYVIMFHRSTCC